VRNTDIGKIAAFRLFSNNSMGVIDTDGNYFIWDNTGNVIHKEIFELPKPPGTKFKPKIVCAVISNNGPVYVQTNYLYSYKYSYGGFSNRVQTADLSAPYLHEQQMYVFTPNFDVCIAHKLDFMDLYQVSGDSLQIVSDQLKQPAPGVLNQVSVSQIAVDGRTSKFIFVANSNSLVTISIERNSTTQQGWMFNPANPSAAIIQDPDAYFITAAACSQTYLAYAAMFSTGTTPPSFNQILSLRKYSNSAFTFLSVQFNFIYVASLAIHESSSRVYILTTDGDLYSSNFSSGSALTTPVLEVSGASLRYASLTFVDDDKLAIYTRTALSVLNISSVALTRYFQPLTFLRTIGTTSFSFAISYNSGVKILDRATHLLSNELINGSIRDVIVNQNTANPRFYVLTIDKVQVFSLATKTRVKLATISTLLSALTPSSISQIDTINSIDILKNNPSILAVLMYGSFTSGQNTSILMLVNELTLAFIMQLSSAVMQGINYKSLRIGGSRTENSVDCIQLVGPNVALYVIYSAGSLYSLYSGPLERKVTTPSPPTNELIGLGGYTSLTTSTTTVQILFTSGRTYIRDTFSQQSNFGANQLLNLIAHPKEALITGASLHLSLNNLIFYEANYFNLFYSSTSMGGSITSSFYRGGPIYISTDNRWYSISSAQSLNSIGVSSLCYRSAPEVLLYTSFSSCSVANCKSCNYMNLAQCIACDTGFVLRSDNTTCAASCLTTEFLETSTSQCYTKCPIEYYHFAVAGSFGRCVTKGDCNTQSRSVFADQCIATCPGTNQLGKCFCSISTNLPTIPSLTCNSQPCAQPLLYFAHFQACSPPIAGYITNSTHMFCNPDTHYFNLDIGRCVDSCDQAEAVGDHPQIGRFCASVTACKYTLGWYALTTSNVSPMPCVPSCPSNLAIYNLECLFTIVLAPISCERVSDTTLLISMSMSIAHSLQTPIESITNNPADFIASITSENSSVELLDSSQPSMPGSVVVKSGNIVSKTVSINQALSGTKIVDFTLNPTYFQVNGHPSLAGADQFSPQKLSFVCLETGVSPTNPKQEPEITKEIGRSSTLTGNQKFVKASAISISVFMTINQIVSPTAIAGAGNIQSGGVLCFIAQTYSKLIYITYLSFTLQSSVVTDIYYSVFNEMLDGVNDFISALILTSSVASKNREVVCSSHLDKLCWLTKEDNFFIINLLSNLLLCVQVFVLFALYKAFVLTRKQSWATFIKKFISKRFWPAYLWEHNLEFAVALLITARVSATLHPLLFPLKLLAIILLITYIIQASFIIVYKEDFTSTSKDEVFPTRLKKKLIYKAKIISSKVTLFYCTILEEVCKAKIYSKYVAKAILAHDIFFAMVIVFGQNYFLIQVILLLFLEVIIVTLAIKYRPHNKWYLNLRLILVESIFLILFSLLIILITLSSTADLATVLLAFSSLIMATDFILTLFVYFNMIYELFCKSRRDQKKKGINPYSEGSSAQSSRTIRSHIDPIKKRIQPKRRDLLELSLFSKNSITTKKIELTKSTSRTDLANFTHEIAKGDLLIKKPIKGSKLNRKISLAESGGSLALRNNSLHRIPAFTNSLRAIKLETPEAKTPSSKNQNQLAGN